MTQLYLMSDVSRMQRLPINRKELEKIQVLRCFHRFATAQNELRLNAGIRDASQKSEKLNADIAIRLLALFSLCQNLLPCPLFDFWPQHLKMLFEASGSSSAHKLAHHLLQCDMAWDDLLVIDNGMKFDHRSEEHT